MVQLIGKIVVYRCVPGSGEVCYTNKKNSKAREISVCVSNKSLLVGTMYHVMQIVKHGFVYC